MQYPRRIAWILWLGGALGACDESTSNGSAATDQVVHAWKVEDLGDVELESAKDGDALAGGDCLHGKVAGLHVDLCTYKDALAADGAREEGVETIGANTGTALARDRYVLVVADIDKVDVHGKILNRVAKAFLEPGS